MRECLMLVSILLAFVPVSMFHCVNGWSHSSAQVFFFFFWLITFFSSLAPFIRNRLRFTRPSSWGARQRKLCYWALPPVLSLALMYDSSFMC